MLALIAAQNTRNGSHDVIRPLSNPPCRFSCDPGCVVRVGAREGARRRRRGRTRDLRGATVTTTGYVNGVPRTQLELLHGLDRVPLGSGCGVVYGRLGCCMAW